MESRMQQFLINNAPLSGFTTSLNLNLTSNTSTPPLTTQTPQQRPISPVPQRYKSSTPRPSSPLPPRPISPLVMESTTAASDSSGAMFFKSSSTISAQQLQHQNFYGNNSQANSSLNSVNSANSLAISPGSSFAFSNFLINFNLKFLGGFGQSSQNLSTLSATPSAANYFQQPSPTTPIMPIMANISSATSSARNSGASGSGTRSARCSFMVTGVSMGDSQKEYDPNLLRLISEGATRFLHHQICEIVADCLQKSREDLLTCAYFCNMSVRLDETLAEVKI